MVVLAYTIFVSEEGGSSFASMTGSNLFGEVRRLR